MATRPTACGSRILLTVLLAAATWLSAGPGRAATATPPEPGSPAPNFALTTQQNDRLWLTQLRGRAVVLAFGCTGLRGLPGCRAGTRRRRAEARGRPGPPCLLRAGDGGSRAGFGDRAARVWACPRPPGARVDPSHRGPGRAGRCRHRAATVSRCGGVGERVEAELRGDAHRRGRRDPGPLRASVARPARRRPPVPPRAPRVAVMRGVVGCRRPPRSAGARIASGCGAFRSSCSFT